MAQAGIHGLVGVAARRWAPPRDWLLLGLVLGTMLPDADNIAVAVAIVAGRSTEGLHRTFTHSLFTVVAIVVVFDVVARATGRARWRDLGLGLGAGVLTHIGLDLLVWFNGVELLWPLPVWVNLWAGYSPPEWWRLLMMPAEFLAFALFLGWLYLLARGAGTNRGSWRWLRRWTAVQLLLFIIFTILVYTMEAGFLVPYGAAYLLSLGLVIALTIRLRQTIAATSASAPLQRAANDG